MVSFDKFQMIEEVKKRTEYGKLIVRVQMSYLRSFKSEYKAMEEDEPITADMIKLVVARLQTMPSNLIISIL